MNAINTQRKTHYRIKSRFRFTAFVVIMLLISVSSINCFLGLNDAKSLTVQEYMSVEIAAGDTLWDIASKYMPSNMDVRKAVYEIKCLNDISAAEIYPGQIISVPVYKL